MGDYQGRWTEEQIARSLAAGIISEERARELLASAGATKHERMGDRVALVGQAMEGNAEAAATLQSYGLDWTQMTDEQEAYQRKKMMKYGAAAAGIAGLAYLFTKGNK
tara:strand:- start:12 stop:335 length:324 start_codon:yes stop_codon:yes gene_type:complete